MAQLPKGMTSLNQKVGNIGFAHRTFLISIKDIDEQSVRKQRELWLNICQAMSVEISM